MHLSALRSPRLWFVQKRAMRRKQEENQLEPCSGSQSSCSLHRLPLQAGEAAGVVKCDQYWPSRGTETYGLIQVTLLDTVELATYCVRTFALYKNGSSEKREVRQFQFTAWPDHGVPEHPTPFLAFLRRVKTCNPPDAGPMVVHCRFQKALLEEMQKGIKKAFQDLRENRQFVATAEDKEGVSEQSIQEAIEEEAQHDEPLTMDIQHRRPEES
ncbi:UNVERIFIED_CONTAM: hypothetical protein K2H54_043591 [Gekko kuhli]